MPNRFQPIEEPRKGSLLLSEPFLTDPNFERTVVLLCEHSEEGTLGFVLNKPIEELTIGQLVDDLEGIELPVFLGGPVEQNLVHYVHRLGDELEGSFPVGNGLHFGGNFEQLKALLRTGQVGERDIRFFLGYSGWSGGQLVEEMRTESWILTEPADYTWLGADTPHLWSNVLKEMGGKYTFLANSPNDPRLN